MAMIALNPLAARCFAASGSSQAPGTLKISMSAARAPCSTRQARAPATSRSVTAALKRLLTMANRIPFAFMLPFEPEKPALLTFCSVLHVGIGNFAGAGFRAAVRQDV